MKTSLYQKIDLLTTAFNMRYLTNQRISLKLESAALHHRLFCVFFFGFFSSVVVDLLLFDLVGSTSFYGVVDRQIFQSIRYQPNFQPSTHFPHVSTLFFLALLPFSAFAFKYSLMKCFIIFEMNSFFFSPSIIIGRVDLLSLPADVVEGWSRPSKLPSKEPLRTRLFFSWICGEGEKSEVQIQLQFASTWSVGVWGKKA